VPTGVHADSNDHCTANKIAQRREAHGVPLGLVILSSASRRFR
jgi:hypothetical protein